MTSPAEKITVTCPNCGHVFEGWHRASINADLDPTLDVDVDAASIATCPKCEHVVDLGTLVATFGERMADFKPEGRDATPDELRDTFEGEDR